MKLTAMRHLPVVDAAAAIAALMFTVAACVYLFSIRPLTLETRALRERVAAREAATFQTPRGSAGGQAAAPIDMFHRQLPAANDAPAIVRRLHEIAGTAGLELQEGNYQPLAYPSPAIVPYQIILPTRGSYAQIRHFLSGALKEFPALALEGIEFRRDRNSAARIDAQLRLTVFLRRSS